MATMEARPILSFLTKAVANVASAFTDKPILPITIYDLPVHERKSPPPSPCKEVVVILANGVAQRFAFGGISQAKGCAILSQQLPQQDCV